MPWYWTDDLAPLLVSQGKMTPEAAEEMSKSPVAIKRREATIDEAVEVMVEDDEIPLAA